jgi:hypothetical protein
MNLFKEQYEKEDAGIRERNVGEREGRGEKAMS